MKGVKRTFEDEIFCAKHNGIIKLTLCQTKQLDSGKEIEVKCFCGCIINVKNG
jgi:hypothetical protein